MVSCRPNSSHHDDWLLQCDQGTEKHTKHRLPSGAAAAEAKANTLSRRIADVLIEVGDETLTLAQIGEILNDRGILTGQGKPWNKSRIRVPLEKARAMIRNDEEKASDAHYKDNPLFGAF